MSLEPTPADELEAALFGTALSGTVPFSVDANRFHSANLSANPSANLSPSPDSASRFNAAAPLDAAAQIDPVAHVAAQFDAGLAGRPCRLIRAGARTRTLRVRRWRADAGRSDRWLLDGCQGPTVDLGCGPGRLVSALIERGVPALGVDSSALAVQLCARRGAVALHRDLFDALPGEGRWHHALLADGNVGIGGDPVALLRRVRRLLGPRGSVLVELAGEPGLWRGPARVIEPDGTASGWFPWAVVGVDAIGALAEAAGLRLGRMYHRRRYFAELRRI